MTLFKNHPVTETLNPHLRLLNVNLTVHTEALRRTLNLEVLNFKVGEVWREMTRKFWSRTSFSSCRLSNVRLCCYSNFIEAIAFLPYIFYYSWPNVGHRWGSVGWRPIGMVANDVPTELQRRIVVRRDGREIVWTIFSWPNVRTTACKKQ